MEQQLLLSRSKGQQAWSSWLNVPLEVFDGQSAAGVHPARHEGSGCWTAGVWVMCPSSALAGVNKEGGITILA